MVLYYIIIVIFFIVIAFLVFLLIKSKTSPKEFLEEAHVDRYVLVDRETDLYNRRFFLKKIEEEVDRGKRYGAGFSLALLHLPFEVTSLDDVNLNKILRKIGSIITKDTRFSDVVARYGREKIGVFFPMTLRRSVDVPTERIKEKITAFLNEEGFSQEEVYFTIYSFPEDASKIEKFIREISETLTY